MQHQVDPLIKGSLSKGSLSVIVTLRVEDYDIRSAMNFEA